ncbi:multidrug transporter [Limnohabitans sp. T6-5]|uniref:efflux transporter outer membrane subunit n=1 Tax=Limnohabitans sp. T6-5 TaxID=1100724 RepID=UPI000D3940A2|nr:efflux transporter outer membrane subunit [Limnohabitans sp. T6-5]PUE11794.1 multidrug transporter [Limnohabitans sp. T6-5]
MNDQRFFKGSLLRLTSLASALSLLSACSLIPTYERPAAPVPAQYPGASEAGSEQRQAADIPWQDFFKDARLQRLIALALDNNRDLRIAMLNIEQTRAQWQLRRADELPTVNAGLSGTRATTSSGSISSTYTAGLSVSPLTAFELDFFGRVRSLSQAAQAQWLASQEARRVVQISLVASVANTYLSLIADDDLLQVAQKAVATREESLRLTRLRFEHQTASQLDLSQAQSLLEGAKVALAQAKRQRAQDENALALLVGQALPADLPASLPLTAQGLLADVPAGLPSDLLIRRPDVRQAEQLLLANNANIGAARAAFFPRVTLTGSAGIVGNDLARLFSAGSSAWTFAPQALLPIFDAGRNQANLDAAKVGRDIAVAQYEKTIQTAFREVADALAARATLTEQLRAQKAQLAAEETRMALVELRERQGLANAFEVLDTRRSLFAAQQAALQTQAQQLQSLVSVYKVLGGGWTEPTTRIQ